MSSGRGVGTPRVPHGYPGSAKFLSQTGSPCSSREAHAPPGEQRTTAPDPPYYSLLSSHTPCDPQGVGGYMSL